MTWVAASIVLNEAKQKGIDLHEKDASAIGLALTRNAVIVMRDFASRHALSPRLQLERLNNKRRALTQFLAEFGYDVTDIDGRRTLFASNFNLNFDIASAIHSEHAISQMFRALEINIDCELEQIESENARQRNVRREIGVLLPECRTIILSAFKQLPDTLSSQNFAAAVVDRLRINVKNKQKNARTAEARENITYLLKCIVGINDANLQSFKVAWRSTHNYTMGDKIYSSI